MALFHFVQINVHTFFGHIIRRYEIMLPSLTHLNPNLIIFKPIVIVFTVILVTEIVLNRRLHLNMDRTTNRISITFVIALRNGQILFVNKRTEPIRTVCK